MSKYKIGNIDVKVNGVKFSEERVANDWFYFTAIVRL
jgi:hypothetical protein